MKTTEELAIEVFEAKEKLKRLAMTNQREKYEDRQADAVEYALAQERMFNAQRVLDERIAGGK